MKETTANAFRQKLKPSRVEQVREALRPSAFHRFIGPGSLRRERRWNALGRKASLACSTLPIVLIVLATVLTICQVAEASSYRSPVAIAADKDGKKIYVAESSRVSVVDLETRQVKIIAALSNPSGLALTPDGSTLYVTCAEPGGTIYAINLRKKWFKVKTFNAGHTPTSPVISPDGRRLYVCNRFSNDVSVFDIYTLNEIARIPVKREPVAATLTPNGEVLFVANLLPNGPANGERVAALVSVIDTQSNTVKKEIVLPSGSQSVRGLTVSPDGLFIYVTHVLSRFNVPTTQLERGWINTNALSIIDVGSSSLLNTVLLDDIDLGASNPWGVACSEDGKFLCVAHSGSHEVSVIDRLGLHEKLARAASGQRVMEAVSSAEDVPNALSFLVNVRQRIALPGKGPRGMAIIGATLYASEFFSDSIAVVDLNLEQAPRSLRLGKTKPMTLARKGELYFHDADLCFQKWLSCSSCHPDARSDGLNWDLLNDGIGNPRNTKSLLLAHKTPPAMISGIRADAESAVRSGMLSILNSSQSDNVTEALDAYLKSLVPVASPHLIQGRLSEAARRGKRLFVDTGCASCHPAPLYTDMRKHDVGTTEDNDKYRELDTPTLVECWRTSPYLHDGRAVTMKDVLTKHNGRDLHGETSRLSDGQLADLTEFVLSQ